MGKGTVTIEIDAPCEAVFNLIHDYDRRLEWDTMLSSAEILHNEPVAAKGVTTRCVGTWRSGRLPLETVYVNFLPGQVAAVKLTNHPPFFDHFAATIRHRPLANGRSEVKYIYAFRARPRWLAFLLDPIMSWALQQETRARLAALKRFLESYSVPPAEIYR